ncbi:MAG: hypothetical protein E7Z89_00225 [Cyanobacteria bacterium SIG28]|nr:hypothetical protein [Cyanobacteria bacterium SIG28]
MKIEQINRKALFYSLLGIIMLFGMFLRLDVYFFNRPFWHDECSLASNILGKGYISYFGVLDLIQSAPPIFMIISKYIFNLFPNYPEYALRFIPCLSSILAIFFFYLLLDKIFSNKLCILVGTFLFSFNFQLIYYAQEFKQYSSDVLMIILSFLMFSKINIIDLSGNKKKCFAIALMLLIFPFISLPTMFVIGAFLLFNFIKYSQKRLLLVLVSVPMLIANALYYIYTLKPAKEIMLGTYFDMWAPGFLGFNLSKNVNLLLNNFEFVFTACKYAVIPLLLFLIGIYIAYKRNKSIDQLLNISLLFVGIASFLHIYPIKERVSLYLIPILIVFVLYSFVIDFKKNKLISTILMSSMLVFLSGYGFNYIKNIPYNPIFKRKDPRSTMQELIKHYKGHELIVYNDASLSELVFYGNYYKFLNKDIKLVRINLSDYGEEWYYSVLKILPKGNSYWFYYPNDYVKKPVIPWLKNWIKNNAKIIYEYEKDTSYLVLVEI